MDIDKEKVKAIIDMVNYLEYRFSSPEISNKWYEKYANLFGYKSISHMYQDSYKIIENTQDIMSIYGLTAGDGNNIRYKGAILYA